MCHCPVLSALRCIILCNPSSNLMKDHLIIVRPDLEMRTLKLREVAQLAQGHSDSKSLSWA